MGMALDENVLDPKQEAYLEWLVTAPSERFPRTKEGYAEAIGVHHSTLHRWEKREVFRKRWTALADEVVGSPERTQRLLDVLEMQGLAGDVAATKLFFQVTGKLQPVAAPVVVGSATSDLSDADLDRLIAEAAARELAARTAGK